MKKFYSFVALISVASLNAQILKETFDEANGKGGNDGIWSNFKDYTPAPENFSQNGWQRSGEVYSGKQCLRIGGSKRLGSITTPKLTGLNGNAILSFRAGAWDKSNESPTIRVDITGGGSLDNKNITIPKGKFETFTLHITDAKPTSRIIFTGKGGNNRFFIDDILVTSSELGTIEEIKNQSGLLSQTLVYNEISPLLDTNLDIYSIDGKHLISRQVRKGEKLNIAHLDTGIYIAKGIVEGKNISVKFIKK